MAKIKKVGHVVLGVRDPQRSIKFYTEALGMELVNVLEEMQMAFLSFGERDHDIAVIKVPDDQPVGSSGLAHTALEIEGGQEQLRELYARLKSYGARVEFTADHVLIHGGVLDPTDRKILDDAGPDITILHPAQILDWMEKNPDQELPESPSRESFVEVTPELAKKYAMPLVGFVYENTLAEKYKCGYRMLASAAGMAASLSFGRVFVGTIVSALLSRLS